MHFHRRDFFSVTFGVFSFFRGPLEGVVGFYGLSVEVCCHGWINTNSTDPFPVGLKVGVIVLVESVDLKKIQNVWRNLK